MAAWFESQIGVSRLEQERSLVENDAQFDGLRLVMSENGEPPSWHGQIQFTPSIGKPETVDLRIAYPRVGYLEGDELPSVFDEAKRFEAMPGKSLADRHIVERSNGDHAFCLTLPERRELTIESPHGFVDFLCAVLFYLEKQFIYDRTEEWPGQAEPHDPCIAVANFLIESKFQDIEDPCVTELFYKMICDELALPSRNSLCPCGSQRKYKRCHFLAVESARYAYHKSPRVQAALMRRRTLNDKSEALQKPLHAPEPTR